MCQLNLYMVPKNVPKEEIVSVFEKYSLNICEDSYHKLDDLEESYDFYSTRCGCDCTSIISRLQKENVSNFNEYKTRKKDEDIEKLNRIKKLKTSKYYETRVKEFEKQRDILWEVVDSFSDHIGDYEAEEKEKIIALGLQEEEQIKMIHETLYPKINVMYKELENNKEYNKALKEFQNYIAENAELNDSIYYAIDEKEKTVNEYDFSDFYNQFSDLKNAYTELFKLTNEICIYPFWQDGKTLEIKGKRQVMIQNLNIENLVFLSYRNLLQIEAIK